MSAVNLPTTYDRAWIDLPLVRNWVRYDTTWPPPQYRKSIDGMVYMRGLCKSGFYGVMGTLPVGYRPDRHSLFLALFNGSVSGEKAGRITVYDNGDCVVDDAGTTTGQAQFLWISYYNIKFLAV